jgi:hypothetical protein
MNPSDNDAHDRNKEAKAFDPPLIHEAEIERSATRDEEEGIEEKEESREVEVDKEAKDKTEVATKEAMIRMPSGQL